MTAEALLSRLDGVRQTTAGRWAARCPAHDDRSASLSVHEKDDGTVLVHCFAGCGGADVIEAVGLTFAALFPPRPQSHGERRSSSRTYFDANAAMHALAHELAVSALIIGEAAMVSPEHADRLLTASARIHAALAAIGYPREAPEMRAIRRAERA